MTYTGHHAAFDDIELDIPGGKGIYPPSEDTFLLLDMIRRFVETERPQIARPGEVALDMGSGAGLATLYLARHYSRVHAIDVNPNAVSFLKGELSRRARLGRACLIAGNLLDALRDGPATPRYAVACFNPPYLPPEDYEAPVVGDAENGNDHAFFIDKALYAPDGGKAVLEGFLRVMRPRLAPGGHVFFIKSSLNCIEDVDAWIHRLGFTIVERTSIHRFFEDIEAYHAIA